MVRLTDRPAMTKAIDLGRKATKQTNKTNKHSRKPRVACWVISRLLLINPFKPNGISHQLEHSISALRDAG